MSDTGPWASPSGSDPVDPPSINPPPNTPPATPGTPPPPPAPPAFPPPQGYTAPPAGYPSAPPSYPTAPPAYGYAAPPPGYSAAPPPGYAAPPPGYAAPPPGYSAAPGWTPPPRPGLVPLGPMGLGTILGASFRVLRRNPRPVVGFSLVIHGILAVISLIFSALFTANALTNYFNVIQSSSTTGQLSQGSVISALTSVGVASLVNLITVIFTYGGQTILQGVITQEVARGTVGEKLPLRALWARTRGRIGALLGWAGLVILITIVVIAILFGAVALLIATGGSTGAIIGGILALVFALGGTVVGIWLWTKLSLVPSALVIERLSIRSSVRRSWSLTNGFFWRTFGIELLVAVMVGIAASIIEFPVTLGVEIATLASNPTGIAQSSAALGTVFSATQIAGTIASAIAETITAIISTAATALIYLDLRIRKEGLDLSLMRFVDARAAGQSDVPDPYLTDESLRPQAPDAVATAA